MASVADLNVRIGADIRGLEVAMGRVRTMMAGVTREMNAFGNQLTMSITAPLALIGAASIKTAGEFENLRLSLRATMQDAGKSIADADAELEKLRKLAMAPGLDFPQAVKGSIVLQNVGMEAGRARNAVGQLANAIAMGGGTAENLDAVVLQFSQMIGKNKILTEDLKPIMGQMPKMAGLMKAAFGTADVELIRSKVSAQEFFDKIIGESEKLERVQGGLANSIVNAFASIKQAGATLGEALDKSLNISARLNAFGDWLNGLVNWFSKLSDGTKSAAIGFGIFIAALGPSIKLVSLAFSGTTMLYAAYTRLRQGILLLSEGLAVAKLAWQGMEVAQRRAMLATGIGAIAAVVIALIAAFAALNHEMGEGERLQKTLNDVNVEAQKSMAGQKVLTDALVETLQNENASLADKKSALKQLQDIAPGYFDSLKIENGQIAGLNEAYKNYTTNILNAAKAKAAQSKIEELAKQNLDIQSNGKAELGFWEEVKVVALAGRNYMALENAERAKGTKLIQENEKAMAELAKVSFEAVSATNKVGGTKMSLSGGGKEKKAKSPGNILASPQIDFGYSGFDKRDFATMAPLVSELANENENLAKSFDKVAKSLKGIQKPLFSAKEDFSDMKERLEGVGETGTFVQKVTAKSALAFADAAAAGTSSFRQLAGAALQAAASVVRAEILEGVAAAVKGALKNVPFPFNLAAAAVAGGAAAALFSAAIAKIAPPKLAMGGLAYGPTLATVGDNANASVNPEVIAPLDKLKDLLGGGGPMTHTIRLDGKDILIVMERAKQTRTRTRGF